MKFTLLVMARNELQGMKEIMPRIDREWIDQILVVDGNSTDGSVEWARSQGYNVYVQTKPGFRQAYQEVWPLIKGDVVITFSPDGNSIPELIPELVSKMEEKYDMVIVSRYLGSARSYDDTFLSAIGNRIFTKTINFLHGGTYTDVMGIYRAYDVRLVDSLQLNQDVWYRTPEWIFRVKGLSWEPLLSVRAARARLEIGEIPGDEPPRIEGVSRVFPNLLVQIQWGAFYYFQVIRDAIFWKAPEIHRHLSLKKKK
jgi:glycosyltransferase involved in cell wall biosynthesis